MIRRILTTALLLFTLSVSAQIDTTKFEIFDVINLKDGGIMKGEIMSFDEATGGLVFKDRKGRVYSFSREEYDYFKENQAFPIKGTKEIILKERKRNELAFQVGFDFSSISLNQYFANNDFIQYGDQTFIDGFLSLKASGGKYLDDKNFAGLTLEYAVSADSKSIFSAGARYKYYYDSQRSNLGLYIPIELKFTSISGISNITTTDTTFYQDGSSSWPSDYNIGSNFSAVTLGLGHGFAFIMANKKELSIEFSAHTYFGMKEEYIFENEITPDSNFNGFGVKGGVYFQF